MAIVYVIIWLSNLCLTNPPLLDTDRLGQSVPAFYYLEQIRLSHFRGWNEPNRNWYWVVLNNGDNFNRLIRQSALQYDYWCIPPMICLAHLWFRWAKAINLLILSDLQPLLRQSSRDQFSNNRHDYFLEVPSIVNHARNRNYVTWLAGFCSKLWAIKLPEVDFWFWCKQSRKLLNKGGIACRSQLQQVLFYLMI